MQLNEWKGLFYNKLKNKIEDFVKEYGHDYIQPNPLQPEELQLKRLGEEMLQKLTYAEYDLDRGMKLASEMLPHMMSGVEWNEVLDEFEEMQNRGISFLEKYADEENVEVPSTEEVFGLSEKTFKHFKNLLLLLARDQDYENGLYISYVITSLFPNKTLGWLGIARCYDMLGEHDRAIEIFELINEYCSEEPVSRIFCSRSYFMLGENSRGEDLIKQAEEILRVRPDLSEIWSSEIADLKMKFCSEEE